METQLNVFQSPTVVDIKSAQSKSASGIMIDFSVCVLIA